MWKLLSAAGSIVLDSGGWSMGKTSVVGPHKARTGRTHALELVGSGTVAG